MKERIKNFWRDPVNKFWLFGILASLFVLSYGTYRLYRPDLNDTVALLLISVALISELIFLVAMIINGFSDTKNDYLELFQKINRNIRFRHYINKNKDKQYKGPSWEDEDFKKITDTKQRVDAYVKANIEFQQADFEAWKRKNIGINLDSRDHTITRSFLIICAAIVSFLSLLSLLSWLGFDSAKIRELIENSKATVLLGVFTTFIGSPVIFVVWLFRDKNNRVQIENSRKDTNLKDFQKLSEWASGFHLPEVKQTTSTKTTEKTKDNNLEETSTEKLTSDEDFLPPDNSNSISRRQGAEALQASAIAQLEAFMFGKYGEQFMQPAFLLIHAIWENIINQLKKKYNDDDDFELHLHRLHNNPILSALNKALAGANGHHLRLFEDSLESLNLSSLNNNRSQIKFLKLAGCNLSMTNLSFVTSWEANLVGTNLFRANLFKADLTFSDLTGANFHYAKLNLASLALVKLKYADLSFAQLKQADLSNAELYGPNLSFTKLEGATLSYTELQGADLSNCIFINANLENSYINQFTLFGDRKIDNANSIREYFLAAGAIWDDDPEWLVGKIQDAALLEKIRKNCAERAKQKGT